MDNKKFEEIYIKFKNPLKSFVFRIIGDRDKAEDIVQEVFLKFFRNRKKIYADKAWLYKVAKNLSIDYLRKEKRKGLIYFSDDEDFYYDPFKIFVLKMRLKKALFRIKREFREVFILREIEGYSYEEISKVLSIPIGTVKSRLRRAREYLRKELKDVL
jgi:RNA polymerase sigma-70 factor (ECF subfamily)